MFISSMNSPKQSDPDTMSRHDHMGVNPGACSLKRNVRNHSLSVPFLRIRLDTFTRLLCLRDQPQSFNQHPLTRFPQLRSYLRYKCTPRLGDNEPCRLLRPSKSPYVAILLG